LLHRNDALLREAEARLDRDDPGWRLDEIESSREQIPDAENSAAVVIAAARMVPPDWPPADFRTAFGKLIANERLPDDDFGRLCSELNELDAVTTQARRLTDMPRGRHRIVLTRPNIYATVPASLALCPPVAQFLGYLALRRAEEGDADGALADCRAAINAGRSTGEQSISVSALVRNGCVTGACTTAARVLGRTQPSPPALTALQGLLEEEDSRNDYYEAMRAERAILHEMIDAIESGQLKFSQASGTGRIPAERLLTMVWQPELKSEHVAILDLMTRGVEATRLSAPEQIATESGVDAEFRAMPRTAVLRTLMPAIRRIGDTIRRKNALVRSLIACLAAERYRQARGTWPATLADLVPTELAAVPVDPFDGQPLRLRRLADGIVIYSVGPDQTDNGGKLAADSPQTFNRGEDLGFRLWDPQNRSVPAGRTEAEKP
jgi:hypothetical protein